MDHVHSLYHASEITDYPSSKIKIKQYKKNKVDYEIWNYDKDFLAYEDKEQNMLCRSVIFSFPQKRLLAYSPGKTILPNLFCNLFNNQKDIYINEYIDGTMVHLFYDPRIQSWEIASKNAVSGNYFLSDNVKKTSKTLRDMFVECLTCKTRSSTNDLHSIELLKSFPKNYSYTFNMLHPNNVIIYPVTHTSLYLTAVYDITPKTKRIVNIPPIIYENWNFLQNSTILFPKSITIESWSDMSHMALFKKNQDVVGYMTLHLPSGKRCKFINPKYEEMKHIRKLDPQYVLHYLCLKRMNLIDNYLQFFPQFRKNFFIYKKHCDEFIEDLHTAYLVKYVWRNMNDAINEKYDKYIHDIHREIYLPSLKNNKILITKKVIHDYIMNKPPGEILYSLYHEKRYILRKM